jgi:hypothetical protein
MSWGHLYTSHANLATHKCRIPYNANWPKGHRNRCPPLVKGNREKQDERLRHIDKTFDVTVSLKGKMFFDHYESLAGLWSDWNRLYFDADFPRLMVRFEDNIFHGEAVMQKIKECVGIESNESFKYLVGSAKTPKSSAGLVSGKCAWISISWIWKHSF